MIWDKYNGKLAWQDGIRIQDAKFFFIFSPTGWWTIIDKSFSSMFYLGWDGIVCDIKNKFGSLVIDIDSSDPELNLICSLAGKESRYACMECGKPGDYSSRYKVLCPLHKIS